MLLLLSQQWMEVLNARHEIRAISLDISCAFNAVWHPALLTKLYSNGIQGHLHSWLTTNVRPSMEFSHPHFLSRLEFLKAVFCALFFFWFSSMISQTLENPLYLYTDDSTLCHTICHPSDQQAATSSLSADLDKITSCSNM